MRVESFLERSVERAPDKIALIFGDRRLSYREMNRAANRLACALRDAGVRRGDRVAIFLENSPGAVVAIFAALKAGGVFVMINPTTKEEKLLTLLNDAQAAALVTDARRLSVVQRLRESAPHLRAVFATGIDADTPAGCARVASLDMLLREESETSAPVNPGIDLDLAALIYTSGSTGRPKGVMLTHLNMVSAATSITEYLENEPSDIILDVLPLSFDYGLYQVLMAFQFGGTVVLERSFTYLHSVLETLTRERVTGFPVVPTIAALLLQLDLSRYDFSSLRYLTNTGAALPTSHIRELVDRLPHVKIYSMYGLTECKRVSYLPPSELTRRPASVGRGMPNQEVYLVDAQGNRLTSGIGELVIRGSHVMQGYWDRPEETAEVLRPGPTPGEYVLHSGDLFRMDEEGYLYFISRMDDIIKTRGEKVSPREIEDVLHRMAAIAEAAVVGVPDPILGQAIKASVVLKPGAQVTSQDVSRHCGQFLEDFMVPQIVEFCDALPKTDNAKSDRRALAAAVK